MKNFLNTKYELSFKLQLSGTAILVCLTLVIAFVIWILFK